MAIADFNGDGAVDVFLGNGLAVDHRAANQILLRGAGGEVQKSWIGNERTTDVALADFDGDGDLDAFTVNRNNLPNHVWLNQNLHEPESSP